MNNFKKALVAIGWYIIGIFISCILAIAGINASSLLGESVWQGFNIAAIVCAALILLLYVANFVCAMAYRKKRNNVRTIYDLIDTEMNKIRSDADAARKKLRKLRVGIVIYMVVLLALASFCAFVAGASSFGLIFVTAILYLSVLHRFIRPSDKPNFAEYSDPAEYPQIYAIAHSAAQTMGIEGDIHILFLPNDNIGIAKLGKKISLQLGVPLLAVLREEELYNILLHEFAHIENSDTDSIKELRFADFLCADSGIPLFDVFFLYPALVYSLNYELYMVFASVIFERGADAKMAERGDKQIAANALYKTALYGIYNSNMDIYIGKPFYEPEECMDNFVSYVTESFFDTKEKQEGFWRELLSKEIQSRSASHPIFRTRLEALGASEYEFTPPEEEGKYREECGLAMKEADKKMYNSMSKDYADGRKVYLEALERAKKWDEDGRPYDPAALRGVTDALLTLYRRDDAYALCNEIIEKENGKGGLCAYAKFTRGSLYFEDYDPRAIDDLYDAASINNNYIDEAIGKVGELCCRLGLAEELEEYRRRAIDFAEKDYDESGTGSLTVRDELCRETTLPPEVFERNLSAIKNAAGDSLSRVFLIRKKITDTLYCSSYVIEFAKQTPENTVNDAFNKIFEHLDNDPDDLQYSLFLYGKELAPVISRVKGCCIYDKEKEI